MSLLTFERSGSKFKVKTAVVYQMVQSARWPGNLTLVRDVREIWKSQGNCGLPVVFYHSCDSHKINITRVLLCEVDVHKMDCK